MYLCVLLFNIYISIVMVWMEELDDDEEIAKIYNKI